MASVSSRTITGDIRPDNSPMSGTKPYLSQTVVPTRAEVDAMASLAGSYEAIFSKRSRKYRALGLHLQTLTEADYRHWLLQDYTFLARPVLMTEDRIFVGNAQKTVEEATFFLHRR